MAGHHLREKLYWTFISSGRRWLGRYFAYAEWEALAAYRGLVQQAFWGEPPQLDVCSDLWCRGQFQSPHGCRPFFTPNRREREGSSHHYGHDIQIKRYAGLPLVGPPMPLLLEHGLKVTRNSVFEAPRAWAYRGYVCMGPLRARWLRQKYNCTVTTVGPWIRFARPLLKSTRIQKQRSIWGKTLLVLLAHSWDRVARSMNLDACIDAVQEICSREGYRQVIWLRHWKDVQQPSLPPGWLLACNGHRSNPWFLDVLRTLFELCDGLASNTFGTHLGYAVALQRSLHWIDVAVEQDLSQLPSDQAQQELEEWEERRYLGCKLKAILMSSSVTCQRELYDLLEPYWGLSIQPTAAQIQTLLTA